MLTRHVIFTSFLRASLSLSHHSAVMIIFLCVYCSSHFFSCTESRTHSISHTKHTHDRPHHHLTMDQKQQQPGNVVTLLKQPPAQYSPPPQPSLNGGLYTGQPFQKGAPWANVPVIPDAGYMTHYNLRSANPPTDALFQYPGSIRPGNNWQPMEGLSAYSAHHSMFCTPCKTDESTRTKFAQYYYYS